MAGVEVVSEQIRTLYRQTEAVLLANCVNATIMGALLWSSAPRLMLATWLFAVAVMSAVRWRVALRYRASPDPSQASARWGLRFVLGSAAAGGLWGLAGLAFLQDASPPARLAIVFFVGGMCSAAAGTLAVYLPAFLAFVVPALAALALRVALLGGALNEVLAVVVALYGVGLYAVAKVNAQALAEAFALRYDNMGLLATLSETQRSLEEANRTLERRVTERSEALRKQSEALRDAQRLEAIGRLAGGVAHDFNNLLTIILANLGEIMDRRDLDSRTRAALREMRDAGTKGADLVRQLLTFSRRQRSTPETLDINRTLSGMDRLLSRLLGDGKELVLSLQSTPLFVHMDPTQTEQIIINLITNARDAMYAGGVVTVETEAVELDVPWGGLARGPYAVLSVTDTGAGMDAETQRHIYEPFFTTKALGKGTGLGLSTVYGIVEQSGGHIDLASQPGKGSCFRVYLPRARAPERSAEPELVRRISGFRHTAASSATLLLVEDEPTVRSVTRRILERAGHLVLTSPTAERALEIASEHPEGIDLLITDVVMPGMSGPTLAARLRAERPELGTLFISGYNQEQLSADAEPGRTTFLPKPFTHEGLIAAVAELLASSARSRRAATDGGSA